MVEQVDFGFHFDYVGASTPGSCLSNAVRENDEAGIRFWCDVFFHCQTSRILRLGYAHMVELDMSAEVFDELLPYFKSRLMNFNCIISHDCQVSRFGMSGVTMQVTKRTSSYYYHTKKSYHDLGKVNAVLNYCGYLAERPCLHVFGDNPSDRRHFELQLTTGTFQELHFYCSVHLESFPLSPILCSITLCNQDCEQGAIQALCKAVKDNFLPNLSHVNLIDCKITSVLTFLHSQWPKLTHLNLFGCSFVDDDFSKLCKTCNGSNNVFPKLTSLGLSFDHTSTLLLKRFVKFPWYMLTEIFVVLSTVDQFSDFAVLLEKNTNIVNLGVSVDEIGEGIDVKQVQVKTLSHLEHLSLRRCLAYDHDFSSLADALKQCYLKTLDLSGTSVVAGHIGILLSNSFLWLETLILRRCKLREHDLLSLSQAYNKRKIPEIIHLDVSDNWIADQCCGLRNFFQKSCTWNQLESLNFRGTLAVIEEMNKFIALGYLSSMCELTISTNNTWEITTQWKSLRKFCIYGCDEDTLNIVAYALRKDFLPALKTLCVQHPFTTLEFFRFEAVHYLLDNNIYVHEARPGTIEYPFQTSTCVCQNEKNCEEHSPATVKDSPHTAEDSPTQRKISTTQRKIPLPQRKIPPTQPKIPRLQPRILHR